MGVELLALVILAVLLMLVFAGRADASTIAPAVRPDHPRTDKHHVARLSEPTR